MIFDLQRFTQQRRPAWDALDVLLVNLESRPERALTLAEAESLETLYHRAASDLNRLQHGAVPWSLQHDLSRLVARAYAEIYSSPATHAPPGIARHIAAAARRAVFASAQFFHHVPRVFRRHLGAAALSLAITIAGVGFGAAAVHFDPAAVHILLPAEYLSNPAARVAREYSGQGRHQPNPSQETAFSAQLITHNLTVSLLTAAFGLTLGLGTGLMLFVNGVMLGAVAAQYIAQGFGGFLAAWLLPHGAFEIPSILLAGQAGFLLAGMLLAGGREPRWQRWRRQLPDFLTLLGALGLLLVWAGTMEAFVSQHHAAGVGEAGPIAAGLLEVVLLACYLSFAGQGRQAA